MGCRKFEGGYLAYGVGFTIFQSKQLANQASCLRQNIVFQVNYHRLKAGGLESD